MAVELKVPSAGESITEVQIATWLKSEGDYVRVDEPVVEIETDKASMEVPAPASGVLQGLQASEGDTVAVDAVIATIDDTAEAPADDQSDADANEAKQSTNGERGGESRQASKAESVSGESGTAVQKERRGAKSDAEPFVMPSARRAMAQTGLAIEDIEPTGPGGRILKEDVLRAASAKPAHSGAAAPGDNGDRAEEVVPMSMLRRTIANRLVESQRNAAILTTFNEIDLSAVMRLRKQWAEPFKERYGIKLGFMSFFVKAAIDALMAFPRVNAEIREHDIVYKHYYDIGVAVSTDRGLLVPVLRGAERLSFAEIELAIADLATRARDKKIEIEELQGGTFTISNGGVFGSLLSTPIINPPQSGILGLHTIQERPVAVDGQVVIRPMMYVALSYDHRIIDGRESVSFLKRIKECVEEPTRMLMEV